MKKLLSVLAVLFLSISSSFAYQQTIYAGPPVGYNGMTVNINAHCSYVKFDCLWSGINGESNGSAVAYGDILIGEYSYDEGTNSPTYSSGIFSSRYWTTVQVYLSAFSCYGQATLQWVP
jgi:hypothetical protein